MNGTINYKAKKIKMFLPAFFTSLSIVLSFYLSFNSVKLLPNLITTGKVAYVSPPINKLSKTMKKSLYYESVIHIPGYKKPLKTISKWLAYLCISCLIFIVIKSLNPKKIINETTVDTIDTIMANFFCWASNKPIVAALRRFPNI